MRATPRLFIVVGGPGSGKDQLIRAVNDLGARHAQVVPKHTSRPRRVDDGHEMICAGELGYALAECELTYENFGDRYGVSLEQIWAGLRNEVSQVLVVSNVSAINRLLHVFGALVVLVYVHSEMSEDEYMRAEESLGDRDYVLRRASRFRAAFQMYVDNLLAFDHVLVHFGAPEDLYDQIFRLFRAYFVGSVST